MSGKRRGFATALAVTALAFAAITLVARAAPVSSIVGLAASVLSAYAPFLALGGLLFAALSRRIGLSIVAVVIVTACAAVQVPRYFVTHPAAGQSVELRVLSSNLRKGQADPSALVPLARSRADVVTVSELTPEAAERFSQAGIGEVFPYSVLIPAPSSGGIGLWSRYPLTPLPPTINGELLTAAARVQVPGLSLEPLVASLHIISPVAYQQNSVDSWQAGIAGAKAALADFARAAGAAPVIVGGDFNSTPDMQQFRALLDGYRDAADQAGAGFVPTFPVGSALPPVLAIDHVLTRGATATSFDAVDIAGSDHRVLLVTVRIPNGAGDGT